MRSGGGRNTRGAEEGLMAKNRERESKVDGGWKACGRRTSGRRAKKKAKQCTGNADNGTQFSSTARFSATRPARQTLLTLGNGWQRCAHLLPKDHRAEMKTETMTQVEWGENSTSY